MFVLACVDVAMRGQAIHPMVSRVLREVFDRDALVIGDPVTFS